MSKQTSLREAERQVFQLAIFQDGWWDILFGGELIMLSLYSVLRQALGVGWNVVLFLVALGGLVTAFYTAKKIFVYPRTGWANLGPNRNVKIGRITAVTLVVATFTFLILIATQIISEPIWGSAPDWIRKFGVDALFAIIIIGFFGLLAQTLGAARLYLYGWLMGLGSLASAIFDANAGHIFHWPMFIAGSIILLVGITLFIRFLRDYPIVTEGA